MRTVHRVEEAWITKDDVYTEEPKNFTGVYHGWFENGQLMLEGNYKGGKLHGLSRGWYDTGQLAYEYNYKDGERQGLCRTWFDTGQLKYEDNFKDGELIE